MQNSFHPASGGGSQVNSRFYEFLKLLHITLKKRKHQVLFTGKVEIDGAFGNANTSCNLVHGHFVIALLDQHFLGLGAGAQHQMHPGPGLLVLLPAHPLGVRVVLLPRGDLTPIRAKKKRIVVIEFPHRHALEAVH